MADRKGLIGKIKALLSKTIENGCTEAEAMAALAVARRMMDEHEITDDDLSFGGEKVRAETIIKTDHDDVRNSLCTSVGRFCHCAAWKSGIGSVVFCGLESETSFAHWLLDVLADFVVRELENFMVRKGFRARPTRIERKSFILGCVGRISVRLSDLTPKPKSTGRDLVLTRQALIEQFMSEHGIKLREPFKLCRVDEDAHRAGVAAGDRAQFNRPVDGREQRRFLR